LSHDHKPELEKEKMRIMASGGRVDKFCGKIITFILMKFINHLIIQN
jgi:Protein phosphatase 2C